MVVATLGMLIGLYWSHRQQPAEDAYILFRYVEMLAAGEGFVFHPGGQAVEGATPTLPTLLLALLTALGIDVVMAKAFLTGMSAQALFVGLALEVPKGLRNPKWLLMGLAAFVLLAPPALATYGGFCTLEFCAVLVWTHRVARMPGPRAAAGLPWMVLLCGTVRPEGLVVAAVFLLLELPRLWQGETRRRLLTHLALVGVAGLAYLGAKYAVFGHVLPPSASIKKMAAASWATSPGNPEWVDSISTGLRGLQANFRWAGKETGALPLLVLVLAGTAAASVRRTPRPGTRGLVVAALVAFVFLLFVEQLQNVHGRFQGPILFLLVLTGLGMLRAEATRRWLLPLLLLALVPGIIRGPRVLLTHLERPMAYAAGFGPDLGRILGPDHHFALTEAGVLAFFSPAEVTDMIGLNHPTFARRRMTRADLRELAPDVLMCHQAHVLDTSEWIQGRADGVHGIPTAELTAMLRPKFQDLVAKGAAGEDFLRASPIQTVPCEILGWAVEDNVTGFLATVDGGALTHLWWLRPGLEEAPEIRAAMDAAFQREQQPDYFSIPR